MARKTDIDWTAAGNRVAEHIPGRDGRNGAVTIETVERIERGFAVLGNGRRYHRRTLLPASTNQGMTAKAMVLRPLTDPDVQRDLAFHEFSAVQQVVGHLGLQSFADPAAALSALEEIERAVIAARDAIARIAEGV